MPLAALRRDSTTRRTRTAHYASVLVREKGKARGMAREKKGALTSKGLFDIDHFAGAGLHEPVTASAGPVQAIAGPDLAHGLQIALVAGDDADGQDAALLGTVLALHVDQAVEVFEGFEGGGLGDVVDEQEGVAAEVGRGPEAAVFLLAGRVGQGERVGGAIDGARDRVRVFDGGIVSVRGRRV